jgi:hypothetical protein
MRNRDGTCRRRIGNTHRAPDTRPLAWNSSSPEGTALRFQWNPYLRATDSGLGIELRRVSLEAGSAFGDFQSAVWRPLGPDRLERLRNR